MKMFALFIFLIVYMFDYFHQVMASQCFHPPDSNQRILQLKNRAFRDYILGHWTYNVIDEYRKMTVNNFPRSLTDVTSRQSKIHGKRSCKGDMNITTVSGIEEQSTCPWYIVMDFSAQREPHTIAKAKCSCKHCYTVERTGKSRDKCTPVNSYIPVVKWRCQRKPPGRNPVYFEYFIDIETIPVGCTCKRPYQV